MVTKGDANYRRLLDDRHWPHDTDFAELMSYWPTSVAALRTCKSGVLVGTCVSTNSKFGINACKTLHTLGKNC